MINFTERTNIFKKFYCEDNDTIIMDARDWESIKGEYFVKLFSTNKGLVGVWDADETIYTICHKDKLTPLDYAKYVIEDTQFETALNGMIYELGKETLIEYIQSL